MRFERLYYSEADNDSLHILPLSLIPVETAGLKRANMVKNGNLDSVVELFREAQAGSGQVDIDAVGERFQWPDDEAHPDQALLDKLATLQSYDVYSLRLTLRDLGIPLTDNSKLRLSEKKQAELSGYMKDFTRPLVLEVFGQNDQEITSGDDIFALFSEPDTAKVLKRLRRLAGKLDISIEDVPKFLDDFGDIYLSLSYYRDCLNRINPTLSLFFESLEAMRGNYEIRKNRSLIRFAESLDAKLKAAALEIEDRFANFERQTKDMWANISAERFREIEGMVKGYQTEIGATLCALSVKMESWQETFPNPAGATPGRMASFMLSDMKPGIEKLDPSKKVS